MPPNPAMGDTDILDQLLEALKANGNLDRAERDRLSFLVFIELIRKVREIERDSLAGMFRRRPIQVIAVITISFVLLHEFATYVNIGVIIRAAMQVLGVPIG